MDEIDHATTEVQQAKAALETACRRLLNENQQQFFGPAYIAELTDDDYRLFVENGPGDSVLEDEAFRAARRYRDALKYLAGLEAEQRRLDAEDWVRDKTRFR